MGSVRAAGEGRCSVTPTTLPALRVAVVRVLVARGESAAALTVTCQPRDTGVTGGPEGVICALWPVDGVHPLEVYAVADPGDEATAIARAWAAFVGRVLHDGTRAEAALARAQEACDRARAALAAAREVGE